MILYLHGFRSSPLSEKSQLLEKVMQERGEAHLLLSPALPASPKQAIDLCLKLIADTPKETLCVIGSSLGGYYATYLAETLGCRAVCINPSVYAPRDLSTQLEVRTQYYSEEPFIFTADYIKELSSLFIPQIQYPERFFLLASKQDELLDWQEMQARYKGAKQLIVNHEDHAFSGFAYYLPLILDFVFNP
ncbi:YqiA/YcfP family alpha/beta fold hydrolase [Pelistega ratti]|uniref:YqiA/YcfP family alpha/beta fold hydrolase n=1 Tax=Pelistega ratti TaxID=2652177 RepID=UPI00135C2090|nr:YqiA/YcfP family alpha/beta fold hydrolase [Pelistega ratti]